MKSLIVLTMSMFALTAMAEGISPTLPANTQLAVESPLQKAPGKHHKSHAPKKERSKVKAGDNGTVTRHP